MWKCKNCKEENEDNFEICWNCQRDKNGNVPIIETEDEFDPEEHKDEFMKEKDSSASQTNKRVLGIILSSIGGIAGIIFGLVLAETNNNIYYFSRSQKEKELITYGLLTGISILICIIGIIMISTTKKTSEPVQTASQNYSRTKEIRSDLNELEKLAELRDKRIITEDEFQAKKKKILES